MFVKYEDIILRAIEEQDLEMLREIINDPETEKLICGYAHPISKFQQKKWFESLVSRSDEVKFIIDTKKYGAIGLAGITNIDWKNKTAEWQLKILGKEELRGNGYGSKVAIAIVKYAFEELNLNCVYAHVLEDNIASQIIDEKCGFIKEGVLRNRIYKNGKYHNVVVLSVLKDEFYDSLNNKV